MKFGKSLLVGAACVALAATSAKAADLTPSMPAEPPMAAPPAPTFSWAGPYAGLVGRYVNCPFCIIPANHGGQIGAKAGYNFAAGSLLVGASADVFFAFDGGGNTAVGIEGNGRAGLLLGDRVLAYGEGGIGRFFGGTTYWTVGGGLEVAVSDTMSIYGEVKPTWFFGGGFSVWRFGVGVNFHFGP